MNTNNRVSQKTKLEKEQFDLYASMSGTVHHFFGGWGKIFGEVSDPREENLSHLSAIKFVVFRHADVSFTLGFSASNQL